jgi:hypothetical protein
MSGYRVPLLYTFFNLATILMVIDALNRAGSAFAGRCFPLAHSRIARSSCLRFALIPACYLFIRSCFIEFRFYSRIHIVVFFAAV